MWHNAAFYNIGFTATRENEFQLTLLSAVSQGEGEAASSRARFGYAQSAKKGRVPNRVYGYVCISATELAIDPAEAEIVIRIFYMFVELGYGLKKIARILMEENIKTKNGGLWRPKTIRNMIRNELYIGKLVSHKTTTVSYLDSKRKKVPEDGNLVFLRPEYAIIPMDMFKKAQAILAEHKKQNSYEGMRISSQNTFSSVLQCECCGRAFTRLYRLDRNGHRRWFCSTRNMGGESSCPNASRIREDELMAEIKRYFSEVLKGRDSLIESVSAELKKAAHLGSSKNEKIRVQTELASLKRQFRKQERSSMKSS